MKLHTRFALKPGQDVNAAREPILDIVGGPQPYIWIGEDCERGQFFASLSGRAHLRRLRDQLTKALTAARRPARKGT